MKSDSLEIAASMAVLGLIQSGDLVQVGAQEIERGCNSPSLRILAALSASEAEGARDYFYRALSELNMAVPSKRDAVMRLARETARGILAGTVDSCVGAKRIWDLTLRVSGEDFPELDSFIYAASEWEERPEDRMAFKEGIVAASSDLVRK